MSECPYCGAIIKNDYTCNILFSVSNEITCRACKNILMVEVEQKVNLRRMKKNEAIKMLESFLAFLKEVDADIEITELKEEFIDTTSHGDGSKFHKSLRVGFYC